jgi:DNA repair protein RadA/Sms
MAREAAAAEESIYPVPNAAQRCQVAGAVPGLRSVEHAGRDVAEKSAGSNGIVSPALAGRRKVQTLSEIEAREEERSPPASANSTARLAAVLVSGGVVLIGGDPGIGKSTLLLQALAASVQ